MLATAIATLAQGGLGLASATLLAPVPYLPVLQRQAPDTAATEARHLNTAAGAPAPFQGSSTLLNPALRGEVKIRTDTTLYNLMYTHQ